MDIQAEVRKAIEIERDALDGLVRKLDGRVTRAVEILSACHGRVIVTGMGKAGLIARKIAATFASTGTPATFLHPAEAFHGDLGFVRGEDVVLALSKSGETEEMITLLPHLKRIGVKLIALTGGMESTLARHSDVAVDVGVSREADPLGIAPTASTTAMLAMGDALSAALLKKHGFTQDQFAIFHPGGSLGNRLLLLVRDLMHAGDGVPLVEEDVRIQEAICVMSSKRLGAVFVVDRGGMLQGIFTDGDLRRFFERSTPDLSGARITDAMVGNPKTVREEILAAEAMKLMEDFSITVLPVVDEDHKPVGALHLHDLVRAGLA